MNGIGIYSGNGRAERLATLQQQQVPRQLVAVLWCLVAVLSALAIALAVEIDAVHDGRSLQTTNNLETSRLTQRLSRVLGILENEGTDYAP